MSGACEGRSGLKTVPRLHIITDETIQSRFNHAELARLAVKGGADCVQFREKRPLTTLELIHRAAPVVDACKAAGALAVIDDRADIALRLGGKAVHLGRHDLDVATARKILGSAAIIGGTANSYDEAKAVWQTEVDYLGVGPIYGTSSKANPAPAIGLETLARITSACPKPVIAIGGVTASRIGEIQRAGAHGVAVLSFVVCANRPEAAAHACAESLRSALANNPW